MIILRVTLLIFTYSYLGILSLNAQQMPMAKIREQFFTMDKVDEGALKLYKSLANTDLTKDPVMLAYHGASSAAAAGSVGGVWKKFEYFNRGKDELDKAIGLKPLDAEIRFLRLATQVNTPGFLNYKADIKRDKSFILQTLATVPANHPNAYLYLRICRFMLSYVELENAEKNIANQLVVKFNPKK